MTTTTRTAVSLRMHRQVRKSGLRRGILATSIATLAASLLLATSDRASAANGSWIAAPTNGNWEPTAGQTNWSTGVATFPGATTGNTSTDVATFNVVSATTAITINNPGAASLNINGITFTGAASNYTVGAAAGQAIFLTSGGTIQIDSSLTATNAIETVNAPLTASAGSTYTFANNSANGAGAGAGTLNFGGAIAGGGGGNMLLTLAGSNTNANTISGVIGGGASTVTKNGTGTWALGGANTYTGATTVNDGTLSLTVANALPLGNVLNLGNAAGSGTPVVNLNGNAQSISALNVVASQAGNPTINLGGAILTLTGNVSSTSNTTSPANALFSTIIQGAGAIDLGNAVRTFNIAGQNLSVNGDFRLNSIVQNGGITMNQTAAGSGTTPAILNLNAANTYNGVTTVNSGVIRVSNNLGLGTAVGNTVVGSSAASTASIQLANFITITGEALTINGQGAVSGTGNLGALGVVPGGNAAVYGGAITAASDATISANGGTLTLIGGISKNGVNLTLGGRTATNAGGTINVNTVGISGAAANSDLLVDSATVNLDVANTYNGKTFILSTSVANTGILNTGVTGAMPGGATPRSTVIMDQTAAFAASGLGGSTLNIGGTAVNPAGANQSIASLSGATTSKVTLGGNTLTIGFGTGVNVNGTANAVFAGVISGNGGIFKDGTSTQILTGNNTYIGQTRVNNGTLQIGDGTGPLVGGSSIAASVPVIVDAAGTLAVNLVTGGTFTNDVTNNGTVLSMAGTVGTGTSQTFAGQINGSGKLVVNAGGTTILANINGYQNGTTVSNASTLQVGTTTAAATAGQNIVTNVITLGGGAGSSRLRLVNVAGGILANNITGAAGGISIVDNTGSTTTTTLTGAITDGTGKVAVEARGAGATLILANANNTYTGDGGNFVTVAQAAGTLQIGTTTQAGSVGTGNITVTGGGTVVLVNIAGDTLANNVIDTSVGAGTLNVNSARTNTISGVLSEIVGTLSLVQSGTGTTILTGANTYAGTTVISGGTLQVGNGGTIGQLGTGAVTNNAILTINRSDAITLANNISGTGVLNQSGTGVTTLSGTNTYTGATNVQTGTLKLGSNGALGSSSAVTVTGVATLDLAGFSPTFASPLNLNGNGVGGNGVLTSTGAATSTFTGPVTLQSSSSIGGNAGGITLTNTVAGGVGVTLTKIGTDTLTINAANTYNGATLVNAGILVAGNNAALGDTAAGTTVANGAALLLANGINVGNEALNINGAGTGAPAPGALTVAAGGTASYAGPITAQTDSTINANGGTLTLTGGINKNAVNLTLAGTAAGGTINIRTVGISGAAANSDLIVESATVNEDIANNYNGQTFIRSTAGVGLGVLNVGVANGLPTANGRSAVTMDDGASLGSSVLNIAGTTLNPAGANQSIASLTSTATTSSVTLGTNTLTIGTAAGTTTFAGIISDTQPAGTANVSIIKDGASTQTFSGVNTYKGITRIDAGTLALSGGGSISQSAKVNVANAAGTFDISATTAGTSIISLTGVANSKVVLGAGKTLTLTNAADTFAGVISGTGTSGLTLTTGTETLTGVNTYTGQTTINGGTLALSGAGSVSQSSRVNVANAAGTFDISATTAGTSIISLAGVVNSKVVLGASKTLTLSNAADTFAGVISGTGSSGLTLTAGAETLSGANTFTGLTTVNGGTLTLQNGAAILNPTALLPTGGRVTVASGGTLNVATAETIGTLSGVAGSAVTLNAALTLGVVGVSDISSTFAGVVSGAGALNKNSGDTFTLSGANTYTGVTTVNGGILRAASPAALGTAAGNTVVTAGTSLQIANGAAVGAEPTVINGTGLGGIGALTQDVGGTSSFAGPITVATNSTISTNGIGTFTLTGAINKNATTLTLTGGGTIRIRGGITGATSFTSDLVVDGTGIGGATIATIDTTASTYAGPTWITNGGTLNANIAGALPAATRTTVIMDPTAAITGSSAPSPSTGSSKLNLGAAQAIQSLTGANATSLVNLNANVLTIGTAAGTTTFAGTVSGAGGGILKDGASTQIFSGANTYTGGTVLNAGTLGAANGSAFGNGNLTVNGGTLQTVGGPLVVNIGTGNVAINGGTVIANVGGTIPGVNHDQILTTGNVGAITGTLALIQQGGYLLAPGAKVNLVQAGTVAGGSVNGTAVPNSSVTGLAAFSITPLLIPTVNLYLTTVTLEAMQGSFLALTPTLGFTPNQRAVAGALDSVAAKNLFKTGVVEELSFLDRQPLSTLRDNLDKIAPEELTSIFHLGVALANVNSNNLTRRMDDIRSGNASAPSAPAGGGQRFSGGSNGPVGRRSKEIAPPNDAKWGAFLTGSGEFTHIGGTTNAAGYNLNTGGVTAGADYRVSDKLAVGLSLGYANTTASLVNGGSLDADGGRLGIYATYFDQNFHVDASVTGGINSYRSRRVTPNNTVATGSPDGSEINVLIGAGYDWKFGAITVGPVASYQYTNMRMDGFTETGAFAPLAVSGRSADSSRTSLGIRASYEGHIGSAIIRPEVRLAWQHEFGATSYAITSRFATLGGNPFTVTGTTVGRDSVLASAGFIIMWNERLGTYLYYDGQIGAQNLESHNISGGVRFQF